jgi:DNA-directed RNA polymerase II subunit RPB4
LACDSADEAKTLIPSLSTKMTDDALQALLNEMEKLRESCLSTTPDTVH